MDNWIVYEPHDDSFLLEHIVKKQAYGRVLDMGTGSGIQAKAASQSNKVESVVAADINPQAVKACKKLKLAKTTCVKSDLFSNISGVFDTIIFNAPYLPQERDSPIIALEGGKHGHEVIERFLNVAGDHLTPNGQILLVFSSHSNVEQINQVITQNMMHSRVLITQKHFFEELFVRRISKDRLRQSLEKKGLRALRYLARGKRGIVYTGDLDGQKVAVKVKNPKSMAVAKIANEARFLSKLNKYCIGPKLLAKGSRYVMYRYVDGPAIREWIHTVSASVIRSVLKNVIKQCYTLDTLGIIKEEMHRPHKHILIEKRLPVMIDFERCRYSEDPKNLTQFCQYLRNQAEVLASRGVEYDPLRITKLAKAYSKDRSEESVKSILKEIQKK